MSYPQTGHALTSVSTCHMAGGRVRRIGFEKSLSSSSGLGSPRLVGICSSKERVASWFPDVPLAWVWVTCQISFQQCSLLTLESWEFFFSFTLQKVFLAKKRKLCICVNRASFQQSWELVEKCVFGCFSFSLSISLLSPKFWDPMVYFHKSLIFVHFLKNLWCRLTNFF